MASRDKDIGRGVGVMISAVLLGCGSGMAWGIEVAGYFTVACGALLLWAVLDG